MAGKFRCNQSDPRTGLLCTYESKRKWNLERHFEDKHSIAKNRFVHYSGNNHGMLQKAEGAVGVPVITDPVGLLNMTLPEMSPISHSPLHATRHHPGPSFNSMSPTACLALGQPVRLLHDTIQSVSTSPNMSPIATVGPEPTTQPPHSTLPRLNPTPPASRLTSVAQLEDEPRCVELVSIPRSEWDEHRDRNRKRRHDLIERDAMPVYQVKRSRKWPQQQMALEWLTQAAKINFDAYLTELLAAWGVKRSHQGTCVLYPADWSNLEPLTVAGRINAQSYPLTWSNGVTYKYAEYSTSLTRTVAWFADSQWPRTGLELDNFLGGGPFKAMQGSHLCHHPLCIIHLIYETVEENQDRKQCNLRAKFLRQENLPVPPECSLHQPPCLMQHAALTTYETTEIQCFVLRKAKDITAITPPSKKPWHKFRTLECSLPVKFCADNPAILLEPAQIASEAVSLNYEGKPALICPFCVRIKAFSGVITLWSHFVHQHHHAGRGSVYEKVVVEESSLLREIQRTAGLWRAYWLEFSRGRKRLDPTMSKLNQVAEKDFDWAVVQGWNL